mgnify:CR=1 FL=1
MVKKTKTLKKYKLRKLKNNGKKKSKKYTSYACDCGSEILISSKKGGVYNSESKEIKEENLANIPELREPLKRSEEKGETENELLETANILYNIHRTASSKASDYESSMSKRKNAENLADLSNYVSVSKKSRKKPTIRIPSLASCQPRSHKARPDSPYKNMSKIIGNDGSLKYKCMNPRCSFTSSHMPAVCAHSKPYVEFLNTHEGRTNPESFSSPKCPI